MKIFQYACISLINLLLQIILKFLIWFGIGVETMQIPKWEKIWKEELQNPGYMDRYHEIVCIFVYF